MIHVDTSALVGALTAQRTAAPALRRFVTADERFGICAIVLYEWWRGPRTQEELDDQEALFPSSLAFPFGRNEAAIAGTIYRRLRSTRNREIDIAIAACAIAQNAALWTLNPRAYLGIPRLELV